MIMKLFGDINKKQKIIITILAIIATVYDFFYIHWFSYRIALHHCDDEYFIPLSISIGAAIALAIVLYIEYKTKTKKLIMMRYVLIVIIIAAFVASRFNGYCPSCNEVHDPIYKYIYKLKTGSEYEYV